MFKKVILFLNIILSVFCFDLTCKKQIKSDQIESNQSQLQQKQSIQLPSGKIVECSTISYTYLAITIDKMTLYSKPDASSEKISVISNDIYIIENKNEWLFVYTDEGLTGWINSNDISKDYWQYREIIEKEIFESNKKWSRHGPFLYYNNNLLFTDTFNSQGPWYHLVYSFDDRFFMIKNEYYEGSFYEIYNLKNSKSIANVYSLPIWSPSKNVFICFGCFYFDGPTLDIFSYDKDNNIKKEYSLKTELDQPSEMENLVWISDSEFTFNLNSIPAYLNYHFKYESGAWNMELQKKENNNNMITQ